MRLAIAATTLLLCFGLMSCNDDGDSKPIVAPSQTCKCKPGEQGAPSLKPQFTDDRKGKAGRSHLEHRGYAGRGHAPWAHHGSRDAHHRPYAAREDRYRAHGRFAAREHFRVHREAWRKHYAARPEHARRWRYAERWTTSSQEYASQPLPYNYMSRSRRTFYDYSRREDYRGHCHRSCDGRGYTGYPDGYRAPMSINDPAALDPWHGYGEDNGFSDW
jgi:hypothetical protein